MSIKELREAVEAGLPSPTNWRDFDAIQGENSILAHRAYYGSRDAAGALVEAMLPHFLWQMQSNGKAYVYHDRHGLFEGDSLDRPARALLIATLKALEGLDDE